MNVVSPSPDTIARIPSLSAASEGEVDLGKELAIRDGLKNALDRPISSEDAFIQRYMSDSARAVSEELFSYVEKFDNLLATGKLISASDFMQPIVRAQTINFCNRAAVAAELSERPLVEVFDEMRQAKRGSYYAVADSTLPLISLVARHLEYEKAHIALQSQKAA